ncbi:MAG: hypothetical protein EOP35_17205 [Rubrivivax sp.]|nr:MAG: hypothetical protein EOP35_17205 [Rubrivivax sp.]
MLLLPAAAAQAECNPPLEARAERLLNQGGAAYRAQLYWNPQGDATVAGGSLAVTVWQGERQVAQAGQLRRVLVQNVAWESWGTKCEPDCADTSKNKSVIVIAAQKSPQGMSDLRVRTRGSSTPYGKDDKAAQSVDSTTRYVFNGTAYEARD